MTENPFSAFDENDVGIYIRQLVESGSIEDVHETLSMETDDGQNAWYVKWQELEKNNLIDGFRGPRNLERYLSDIERARQVTEKEVQKRVNENNSVDNEFEFLVRYLLINASLTSIANRIDPDLAVELIEHDLVSPEWGLQVTNLLEDQLACISVLLATAKRLDEKARMGAFDKIIEFIPSIYDPFVLLEDIAEKFPPEMLDKLIQKIETLREGPDGVRSRSLAALLPVLGEPKRSVILQKCLDYATDIEGTSGHAILLLSLAPFLSKSDRERLINKAMSSVSTSLPNEPDYFHWRYLIPRLATNNIKMEVLQKLLEMVKDDAQRDDLWSDTCFALIKKKKYFEAWTVFQSIKSDLAKIRCLLAIQPITPASFLLMMIYSPRKLKFSQRLRAIRAIFFDKDAPNATDQQQLGETLLSVIWNNPKIIANDIAIGYTINLLSYLTSDLRDIATQKINTCLLEETDAEKRTRILARLSDDNETIQSILSDTLSLVEIDDKQNVEVWDILSQSIIDRDTCHANLFQTINLADKARYLCLYVMIKWLPASAIDTAREIIISYENNSPILTSRLINRMTQLGQSEQARNLLQGILETALPATLNEILPILSRNILNDEIVVSALEKSLDNAQKQGMRALEASHIIEQALAMVSNDSRKQILSLVRNWTNDAEREYDRSDILEVILPYQLILGEMSLEMIYEQIASLPDYYHKAIAYARLSGVVSGDEQQKLINLAKEDLALAKNPENWPEHVRKMTQYMGILQGVPEEWAYKNPLVDYDLGIAFHLAKVLPPEESTLYWRIASRDDDIVKEIKIVPEWLFWEIMQYYFSTLESKPNEIKFDTEILDVFTEYIEGLSLAQKYDAYIKSLAFAARKGRKVLVLYLGLSVASNQDIFTINTIERISNSLSMTRRWWK